MVSLALLVTYVLPYKTKRLIDTSKDYKKGENPAYFVCGSISVFFG